MIRLAYRNQRTIARPVTVSGVGFVTGAPVRVVFRPAAANTGLMFQRIDLPGSPCIPANISRVTATTRRTTIAHNGAEVTLVEHVLSALAGLRIDNCLIAINAAEPPGLDGSALGFVEALRTAGIVAQPARRGIWTVPCPRTLCRDNAALTIHPTDRPGLKISYRLDYGPKAVIAPQQHTIELTPESYCAEIASSRTFVTVTEAQALRSQGIGTHLTATDLLVFDAQGPIGNPVRYADEPARHKILDIVGDLALCGIDLAGHIVAYRSGHLMNVELARDLTRDLLQTHLSFGSRRVA